MSLLSNMLNKDPEEVKQKREAKKSRIEQRRNKKKARRASRRRGVKKEASAE